MVTSTALYAILENLGTTHVHRQGSGHIAGMSFLGSSINKSLNQKSTLLGSAFPRRKSAEKESGRERVKRGYQGEAIVTMATQDSSGERKKGEELSPSS